MYFHVVNSLQSFGKINENLRLGKPAHFLIILIIPEL